MTGRLNRKIAIFTGVARGLGLGISDALRGRRCRGGHRGLEETTAVEAAAYDRGGAPRVVDVTERESVQQLIDAVVAVTVGSTSWSRMRHRRRAPFLELTDERWDSVIAVNLRGVFCAQIAGRQFVHQGGARSSTPRRS